MDPSTQANEHTWDKLARNNVLCSQPKLALTVEEAQAYINRHGFYPAPLQDKQVLCLASGGGQQSIAFALLGAQVTVVDFSQEQLTRDRQVAEVYGIPLRIVKSDMRDLSQFEDASFDVVYQPYSINYIPSVQALFDEVARVLKPGGTYDLMFHNPFVHGSWKDGCWGKEWKSEELWQGKGYPIWQPYQDGYPIQTDDPHWNFANQQDASIRIKSPQEYRHTLSTLLNGLIARQLEIIQLKEEVGQEVTASPGSWEHYTSCAPPWMYLLTRKRY